MAEDRELEALRRRKLLELQQKLAEEQRRIEMQRQVEMQKQAILRRILTSEARQRLTNIKMVKPEFASQIEMQLIQLAQAGRLKIPVTDEQLKLILKHLQPERRNIRIRRI